MKRGKDTDKGEKTGIVIKAVREMSRKDNKTDKSACLMKKALFAALVVFAVCAAGCGKTEKTEKPEDEAQSEEAAAVAQPSPEEAEAFAGEWTDEANNAVMDIWVDENNVCHVEVSIGKSDNEVSYWSFTGIAEDSKLLYTDCERVDAVYSDSWDITETSCYERGRRSLALTEGKLIWSDAQDNAGEGLSFVYYSEY